MSLTIGVDVGGTKIAAGVVDEKGSIVEMVKRPTPAANASGTIEAISDAIRELLTRHDVDAVGIGAAGFIEESRSSVMFAPNLAWREEPVARQVEERTGKTVFVENDANAAVWAETKLGAGRGHDHVMLITIGTGIGAGVVLNGQLYRGRWGMAGEPGHYRVVPDGRLCGCGNRGCWEQYASGSALAAEARDFARRSPGGAVRLLQLAGGTVEGITGHEVTVAAREGDAAALRCFEIIGRWLGEGLADLAAILDPGCFVLGGGVSEAGDLFLDRVREAFDHGLTGRQFRPHASVVLAELGPDAGLIGAADLARKRLARLDPVTPGAEARTRGQAASQTTAP
jgi:glucokinase